MPYYRQDMGTSTPASTDLHYHLFQTELGLMLIGLEDRCICFLHFGTSGNTLLLALKENFPRASLIRMTEQHTSLIRELEGLIRRVLKGDSADEVPSLVLKGTPFQREVWRHLRTIPQGEVRSYSDVAREIGRPKAVRAVASACARNTIALLIPCHRVTREDGTLGGYRWGVHKKASLLESEKRGLRNTQTLITKASM